MLHAGLAFGAFHHWIYKPAKAGELSHPLEHKLTTVKAALASAFVYHELKLALADAQADPTLSKLVAPITDLENKLHGLAGSVKSGGATSADVDGARQHGLVDQESSRGRRAADHRADAGHPERLTQDHWHSPLESAKTAAYT